jgi:hypothetical protein
MIHSRSSAQLGSCVAQAASLLPHWTGFGVSPTAGMTLTRARIAIHFFFPFRFLSCLFTRAQELHGEALVSLSSLNGGKRELMPLQSRRILRAIGAPN